MKMKAKAVLDQFINYDPTKNDINTNWSTKKSILNNILSDYVPYRISKSRHNLPWIRNEIKCSRENEIDYFLELRNKLPIPTGQILEHFGNLLLNLSHHQIKNRINDIIGNSLAEDKDVSRHMIN